MAMQSSEILFTRQRHDAKRAGLHYDIRLVHGSHAYSFATRKEIPEPGQSIIMYEQPVHTRDYALRKHITIPAGSYGAGTTTLDFVRKAVLLENKEKGYFTMETTKGEKYLLKPVGGKYGNKAWLFRNLSKPVEKKASMTNKFLEKIAAKEKERPHTERALAKLDRTGGLLIDHSMGSGKTRLYLKAIERYQKANPDKETLFIAPASLTTNVDKEIAKHGIKLDRSKLEVLSYEKATNSADKLRKNNYGMVVLDEAHKMRTTGTKRSQELTGLVQGAERRLLGTGTATYNHVSDIAPLVNMTAGYKVLPEGKAAFEKKFVGKKIEQPPLLKRMLGHSPKGVHNLKNTKKLGNILRQHIDHYDLADDPSAKDKFPTKTEVVREVEMSPEQLTLYKYMENKLPWRLRLKVRMNMPLDKKESANLNSFSSGVRQVSNSLHSFMPKYEGNTPKIMAAADSLEQYKNKDKNFRGLVYSNFLGSGLEDYSKEMHNRGIEHAVYHGGLSRAQKDKLLVDYNEGRTPVLLLSSSGAEGLNTKGTKLVQILEPHHNASKVQQVVARGVRYESHEHLPKNERTVNVEHYHSVFPKERFQAGPKQHSIDQYLHHHSATKADLGNQIKNLVKE